MTHSHLLVRPAEGETRERPRVVNRVLAKEAGWEHLNMEVRRFASGDAWTIQTNDTETVLVILGGRCSVTSSEGHWQNLGERDTVFDGMPTALYFSRNAELTINTLTDNLEIARCWVKTDQDHPARLICPEDCAVEIRGGNHATRQINSIVPPGFGCHRIVCVEVFTPGGNWSSYPGHKHDQHIENDFGEVLEADLEEIYYYKIRNTRGNTPERAQNGAGGFAIQRVYNDDRSLDETIPAQDNDIVLIPEGYHPVSAAEGYDCYYLNFLAGSAQSLAATDDPEYAWVKDTWTTQDARLPLVRLKERV